jgi:integrase/recombinase XerD
MSSLRQHSEDYLRLRRAMGFKLERDAPLLASFVSYMEQAGAEHITVEHAVRWATLPTHARPVYHAKRLRAVRGFARYLNALDPENQLLATDLLGSGGWRRSFPYIYTPTEIADLMAAAGRLKTRLGAASMRTLIGLLAATGMRLGEAIRLDRDDLDLEHGRLLVLHSKFGKSRQLPLHPTTVAALLDYLRLRDALKPRPKTSAVLIGTWGGRLRADYAEDAFRLLRHRVGLQARPGSGPPRLHDLRHTFAVRTMLDAYRNGGDPTACASALATYLGHADPGASYWYLSAAPELLALAAKRLDTHSPETWR